MITLVVTVVNGTEIKTSKRPHILDVENEAVYTIQSLRIQR